MTPLYTAQATCDAKGRGGGHAETSDGKLKVDLALPKEMGGPGGSGTNPEQLVALGYSACFAGALGLVASQRKVDVANARITCRATIGKDDGGFGLSFELDVSIPGLPHVQAQALVDAAHNVCPYSKAFKHGAPAKAVAIAEGA